MPERNTKIKAIHTRTGDVRIFHSLEEAVKELNINKGNASLVVNEQTTKNYRYPNNTEQRRTVKGWKLRKINRSESNYTTNVKPFQNVRYCDVCYRMITTSQSEEKDLCPICYRRENRKKVTINENE